MRPGRAVLLAAALLLAGAPPALADLTPDWFQGHAPEWNECAANPKVTDEQRIAGCTAIIKGGKEAALYLATAYQYRGEAYFRKGDKDHALQDFDQAIKLLPEDTDAASQATRGELFRRRGYVYATKGDLDRGIQDFSAGITRSTPRIPPPLATGGRPIISRPNTTSPARTSTRRSRSSRATPRRSIIAL